MIITTTHRGRPDGAPDHDEALSTRLRDLSLVNLDALTAGLDGTKAQALVGAFADDCLDALEEARARMTALKKELAGPDPLNVLDLTARQRAADAGHAGADRVRERLGTQAEAGRAYARLADLASALVPRLFEADRRR